MTYQPIRLGQAFVVAADGGVEIDPAALPPAEYVHLQASPAVAWVIPHQLGRHPAVRVVDSGDRVVMGDVTYDDADRVTLGFAAAFAGKAYLS